MNGYGKTVSELEARGIMPDGLPSLEPMRRALERTGLLGRIDPSRNVVIAGTNGKGSVAATLSALVSSAGRSAGLYTSPHLITTRERIRVGERDLGEETFVAAYDALREVIDGERLTHFEALTLMAAYVFFSGELGPPVEWGIWEVGLGGLFDATNAIPHRDCAITRLGLDHQLILGESLEQIARQKFGVIGSRATVVYSPMDPGLRAAREETAARTGCRWVPARPAALVDKASLSLQGARAAENTATALGLFEVMGFDPSRHLDALAQVRWPGRFSRVDLPGFACPVHLSGDHNVQGIESLLEILGSIDDWKRLHLMVGIGKDKEAESMLEKLRTLPRARLYLTETSFKPLALEDYPARFLEEAALAEKSALRCLSLVREAAREGDRVVVTGSLYLVGLVLQTANM